MQPPCRLLLIGERPFEDGSERRDDRLHCVNILGVSSLENVNMSGKFRTLREVYCCVVPQFFQTLLRGVIFEQRDVLEESAANKRDHLSPEICVHCFLIFAFVTLHVRELEVVTAIKIQEWLDVHVSLYAMVECAIVVSSVLLGASLQVLVFATRGHFHAKVHHDRHDRKSFRASCSDLEYFGGADVELFLPFLLSRNLGTLELHDRNDVYHLLSFVLSDSNDEDDEDDEDLPSPLSLSKIHTLDLLNATGFAHDNDRVYRWHNLGKFNNLCTLMLPESLEVSAQMVDTLPSSIQEVVLWYRQRGAVEFFVNRYGLNLSVLIVADEPTPEMHTAVDATAKEFSVEIEFRSYDRNEVLPCDE